MEDIKFGTRGMTQVVELEESRKFQSKRDMVYADDDEDMASEFFDDLSREVILEMEDIKSGTRGMKQVLNVEESWQFQSKRDMVYADDDEDVPSGFFDDLSREVILEMEDIKSGTGGMKWEVELEESGQLHSKRDIIVYADDEDLPSGYFDYFSNQDFMAGSDVVDVWNDKDKSGDPPDSNNQDQNKRDSQGVAQDKSKISVKEPNSSSYSSCRTADTRPYPRQRSRNRRRRQRGNKNENSTVEEKDTEIARKIVQQTELDKLREAEKTKRDIQKVEETKNKEEKFISEKLKVVETGLVLPSMEMKVDLQEEKHGTREETHGTLQERRPFDHRTADSRNDSVHNHYGQHHSLRNFERDFLEEVANKLNSGNQKNSLLKQIHEKLNQPSSSKSHYSLEPLPLPVPASDSASTSAPAPAPAPMPNIPMGKLPDLRYIPQPNPGQYYPPMANAKSQYDQQFIIGQPVVPNLHPCPEYTGPNTSNPINPQNTNSTTNIVDILKRRSIAFKKKPEEAAAKLFEDKKISLRAMPAEDTVSTTAGQSSSAPGLLQPEAPAPVHSQPTGRPKRRRRRGADRWKVFLPGGLYIRMPRPVAESLGFINGLVRPAQPSPSTVTAPAQPPPSPPCGHPQGTTSSALTVFPSLPWKGTCNKAGGRQQDRN